MTVHYQSEYTTLYLGNTLAILPTIPSASVDAIITDPPYPEISRDYGRLTEWEWTVLMLEVCRQAQRVLKPTGSAVFILQPNSRKVGSMRGWLWEFMAWVCREWNMVQDVWWWNYNAMPNAHTNRKNGLMRPSVKACVWCGPSNCYRNQEAVLREESKRNVVEQARARAMRITNPSGHSTNEMKMYATAQERGGVTPFNMLLVVQNQNENRNRHGAGTPLPLADWWTRYIAPPNSIILDPFVGAGTMGIAALLHGHKFIGVDKEAAYLDISTERCREIEQQRRGEMHLRPKRPVVAPKVPVGQMEMFG